MTVTEITNVVLSHQHYSSGTLTTSLFYENYLIPDYDNYVYLQIPSSITESGSSYSGFTNFRRTYNGQTGTFNEYSVLIATNNDLLLQSTPKVTIVSSGTFNMNGTNVECLKLKLRFTNVWAETCMESGHTYEYCNRFRAGEFYCTDSNNGTWIFTWEMDRNGSTQASGRIPYCTFAYSGLTPTVSIAASDPTGYYDDYGKYIVGLSKVNITTTITLKYGATVASATAQGNGKSLVVSTTSSSVSVAQFGVLKSAGNTSYSVTVTDSRGKQNTASVTIVTLAYTPPTVVSFTAERCNQDGTSNSVGAYGKISYSVKFGSNTADNDTNIRLEWNGATTGYYNVGKASSHVKTGTYIFAATTSSSYEVTIKLTDHIRTSNDPVILSVSMSTASVLMDWRQGGKGIAFGKICEHDGRIEFPDPAGTGAMVIYIGSLSIDDYIRKASLIDSTITQTTTVSDIVTASTGFTISSAYFAQWGNIAQLYFTAKRTGTAITGADTTTQVAAVVSGKRPAFRCGTMVGSTAGASPTKGYINGSGGQAYVFGDIANNQTFYICATYIIGN